MPAIVSGEPLAIRARGDRLPRRDSESEKEGPPQQRENREKKIKPGMAGAEDYPDWLMSEEPLDARAHDAGARPNGDAEGATGRPGSARVDSSGRESSEMTPPGASFPSGAGDQGGTQCMQCGTENTPLWRTIGREILCVSPSSSIPSRAPSHLSPSFS